MGPSQVQVVPAWKAKPELGSPAQGSAASQACVCRHGPAARHKVGEAERGHADGLGQAVWSDA